MTPATRIDVGTDPPSTAGPTVIAHHVRARALRRGVGRGRPPAVLLAPAVLDAAVAVAPLIYLVIRAAEGGLGTVVEVLVRDRTVSLVLRSLALAGAVTAICLVLGVSLAGLVVRTRLPGRRVWGVLVVLPLAVPSYVAAFAWLSMFPRFGGFLGSTLVLSLCCYPYVYLPVAAALARIDPAHEEVARSLGRSPAGVLCSVTMPLAGPGIAAGAALVFLTCMKELPATLMQAPIEMETLATELWGRTDVGAYAAAAPYAAVLLLLAALPTAMLTHRWGATSRESADGAL